MSSCLRGLASAAELSTTDKSRSHIRVHNSPATAELRDVLQPGVGPGTRAAKDTAASRLDEGGLVEIASLQVPIHNHM